MHTGLSDRLRNCHRIRDSIYLYTSSVFLGQKHPWGQVRQLCGLVVLQCQRLYPDGFCALRFANTDVKDAQFTTTAKIWLDWCLRHWRLVSQIMV